VGEKKEDPLDFALWKAAKPGEPAWDSPWGKGRPGWHIECSAMNLTHLGAQIDIHGGGNDLIFPHHENEIAQTECFTDKTFARYWVHNGMLQFSGEKMSKSIGNLITIEEFLSSHSGETLRFLVLNSGYRNPLTYNDEILQQAESGLDRFRSALRPALPGAKGAFPASLKLLLSQMEVTKKNFIESMDDDFNSAGAMGFLFEFVRVINQTRADGATDSELDPGQTLLRELTTVLGLRLESNGKKAGDADPFIKLLLDLRKSLRDQKLWTMSDQIRDGLSDLGVIIEDNKEGTTWRWK
jgi:cysteinyl-tRNA synthetase